ncbi:MAG: TIGR02584 family CRISPR-associated protein [Ferrovum myxofaciens]|jgi:CRISPR-associated protein (TIGR02584 family)|nr:TIGR02584 family CRISPR-associated protein [Ferrovum myxofaciens]
MNDNQNKEDREMKRILLCAIGMSPQIVTETIYALAVHPNEGRNPWIPTEIHLITTGKGAHHARLNLLSGKPGWFHQLCQDYRLPSIEFPPENIHILENPDGTELEDIRTVQDNESAADQTARLVSYFTRNPQVELHVSLAGGRKTMGYYLGYALSLFGRSQDRLSHVLVNEPYEAHPDFYYPTPYEHVIHTRDPKSPEARDCQDAVVALAEIPFVRLRDGLPERLLDGRAGFMEAVLMANRMSREVCMRFSVAAKQVWVNDVLLPLKERDFALYLWFAHAKYAGTPEIDWLIPEGSLGWREGYLRILRELGPSLRREYVAVEEALEKSYNDFEEETAHYLSPLLSRLNKRIRKELGESLAQRCMIQSRWEEAWHKGKKRRQIYYFLPHDLSVEIH